MAEALMFWTLVLCAGYFIGAILDAAALRKKKPERRHFGCRPKF